MKKILTLDDIARIYADYKVEEMLDHFRIHHFGTQEPDLMMDIPKEAYYLGNHLIDWLLFITDDGLLTRCLPFYPHGEVVSYLPGMYTHIGDEHHFIVTRQLKNTKHVLVKVEWDRRQHWLRHYEIDRVSPLIPYVVRKATRSEATMGDISGIDYYIVNVVSAMDDVLESYFYNRQRVQEAARQTPTFVTTPPVTGWDSNP